MGARSTDELIRKPLLSFAERFGLTLCLWPLISTTFFAISSSVGLLVGSPFGARWMIYQREDEMFSWFAILTTWTFQWFDEHLGSIAFLCLAPTWLLFRQRPRLLAAFMMATALVVSCGLIPQFSHVWTIIHQWPMPPNVMQSFWTVEVGEFTYVGVIALVLIAIADRIDRECRLREADRAVQRNSGPSEDRLLGAVHRRGHRQRALVKVVLGGGLRPWMALARILPVASLPAIAIFCVGGYRAIIASRESFVASPALASFATPPPLSTVQLRLHASGEGVINLPEFDATSWKALLRSLRVLEKRNGKALRIELAVAPDANLQVIVDALSALERAGFRDLVFADN